MLKEIFTTIDSVLAQKVPSVRWIDFDLGQLDMAPPPVSWPCVLVGLEDGEFMDLLGQHQQGVLTVSIRVGIRLHERTHSKAAQSYRDEALTHLDILHQIHMALHTAKGPCVTDFRRVGYVTENRDDYRIYTLRYDVTAYEGPMSEDDLDYKNWKMYDTKPETVDPDFIVVVEPEDEE